MNVYEVVLRNDRIFNVRGRNCVVVEGAVLIVDYDDENVWTAALLPLDIVESVRVVVDE